MTFFQDYLDWAFAAATTRRCLPTLCPTTRCSDAGVTSTPPTKPDSKENSSRPSPPHLSADRSLPTLQWPPPPPSPRHRTCTPWPTYPPTWPTCTSGAACQTRTWVTTGTIGPWQPDPYQFEVTLTTFPWWDPMEVTTLATWCPGRVTPWSRKHRRLRYNFTIFCLNKILQFTF